MPSEQKTTEFLTLCLKNSDLDKIDFNTIAAELGITANAASLRWGRLRKAFDVGKSWSGSTGPDFLFLCLKYSNFRRINFHEVGKALGITTNAASLRWGRLRKSLGGPTKNSEIASPSGTPTAASKRKRGKVSTPSKRKLETDDSDDESTASYSPVVKRVKRQAATKAAAKITEDVKVDSEDNEIEGALQSSEVRQFENTDQHSVIDAHTEGQGGCYQPVANPMTSRANAQEASTIIKQEEREETPSNVTVSGPRGAVNDVNQHKEPPRSHVGLSKGYLTVLRACQVLEQAEDYKPSTTTMGQELEQGHIAGVHPAVDGQSSGAHHTSFNEEPTTIPALVVSAPYAAPTAFNGDQSALPFPLPLPGPPVYPYSFGYFEIGSQDTEVDGLDATASAGLPEFGETLTQIQGPSINSQPVAEEFTSYSSFVGFDEEYDLEGLV